MCESQVCDIQKMMDMYMYSKYMLQGCVRGLCDKYVVRKYDETCVTKMWDVFVW